MIKQLQQVQYEKRTDQIHPVGQAANAATRGYIQQAGYMVVEPVIGWSPYTHLIELDDFDLGHRYYLAEIA